MTPKNKKGGVVSTTVFGVGGLLIAVIVLLTITSTLLGAGLFEDQRRTAYAYNTTTTLVVNSSNYIGFGNYTLDGASCASGGGAIQQVKLGNGTTVTAGEYTYNSTCYVTHNGTTAGFNNSIWFINSTMTYEGSEEYVAKDVSTNMTSGINNISEKIPTILLIVAVVFLFGALVLLVRNAGAMRIASGTGNGSL